VVWRTCSAKKFTTIYMFNVHAEDNLEQRRSGGRSRTSEERRALAGGETNGGIWNVVAKSGKGVPYCIDYDKEIKARM
jgi:hypothetical protein